MQHFAQPNRIAEGFAVQASARVDGLAALCGAELTSTVEILERKADWIGDHVTPCANRVFQMDGNALALCLYRRFGVLDCRKVHVRGRPRHDLAQEQLTQGLAAPRRRAAARMGMDRQEADLGEEARPRA